MDFATQTYFWFVFRLLEWCERMLGYLWRIVLPGFLFVTGFLRMLCSIASWFLVWVRLVSVLLRMFTFSSLVRNARFILVSWFRMGLWLLPLLLRMRWLWLWLVCIGLCMATSLRTAYSVWFRVRFRRVRSLRLWVTASFCVPITLLLWNMVRLWL